MEVRHSKRHKLHGFVNRHGDLISASLNGDHFSKDILLMKARKELGYSDGTPDYDIYNTITKRFEWLYKARTNFELPSSVVEYLPYYGGSRVKAIDRENKDWWGIGRVKGDTPFAIFDSIYWFDGLSNDGEIWLDEKEWIIKLILIPADEMPEKLKEQYYSLCKRFFDVSGKRIKVDTPESLLFLLRSGVDCFDLIDRGLAISEYSDEMMSLPIEALLLPKEPDVKSPA